MHKTRKALRLCLELKLGQQQIARITLACCKYVVSYAQRVCRNCEGGIRASTGWEKGTICDEQISDVVRPIVGIYYTTIRIQAGSARATHMGDAAIALCLFDSNKGVRLQCTTNFPSEALDSSSFGRANPVINDNIACFR
jgi:hypothetical protein